MGLNNAGLPERRKPREQPGNRRHGVVGSQFAPQSNRFELEEAPARLGMRPETRNGGGWGSTMTAPKLCGGGSLCELEGKAGGSEASPGSGPGCTRVPWLR